MSELSFQDTKINTGPANTHQYQQDLHPHDGDRLRRLVASLGPAALASFEGQPLYANQPWDKYHDFTYSVISQLAQDIASDRQRLDVLYDDFTVSEAPYALDYYLDHINHVSNGQLASRIEYESAMAERADEWINEFRSSGRTTRSGGIRYLGTEHDTALTTVSGRPTCAVLDAVYQTSKAETGSDTALLVHSTDFRRQQRDMQAVLTAAHGGIPFQSFANIYIRERKGLMRLAGIQVLKACGAAMEIV